MKKIIKNKNLNKLKKSKKVKEKFLTEIVFESKLEKILDERFKENNQVILSAVSEMMKKNIEDSERRMLAYTELRTQETLDILKDERQINKERYEETKDNFKDVKKRLSSVEFKVDHVIDKIDNHEDRIVNLEKVVFEEK
jgi:hypothetical protein